MKVERRKTKYFLIAIAALLVALMAQPAAAITLYRWVGPNTNTDWSNPNNWDILALACRLPAAPSP